MEQGEAVDSVLDSEAWPYCFSRFAVLGGADSDGAAGMEAPEG